MSDSGGAPGGRAARRRFSATVSPGRLRWREVPGATLPEKPRDNIGGCTIKTGCSRRQYTRPPEHTGRTHRSILGSFLVRPRPPVPGKCQPPRQPSSWHFAPAVAAPACL